MIWKTIDNWPYEVSDCGAVRRIGNAKCLVPMRQGEKRRQYNVVSLCDRGHQIRRKVHILVLEAFVGRRPLGMLGLHKDDDSTNDSLINLYWGTPADNANDARYTNSKLTQDQVEQIKQRRRGGERGADLSREFCVSQQLICDIHKGRSFP